MPVYPVGTSPTFVTGVYSRPYIVKNSGDVTVYLSQSSALSISGNAYEFSLPAGSTLNWSGETELWAAVVAGGTGQLELLFTGENSFTPGPSVISIRSDVDVLTQVSTTDPVFSYDNNKLSSYNTLYVNLYFTGTPSGANNLECVTILLTFTDAVGALYVRRYRAYGYFQGTTSWAIPIESGRVSITIVPTSLANLAHTIQVSASSRAIAKERYATYRDAPIASGVSLVNVGSLATAVQEGNAWFRITNMLAGGYVLLPGIYGEASFTWVVAVGAAGAIDVRLGLLPNGGSLASNVRYFGFYNTVGSNVVSEQKLTLARAPIVLFMGSAAPAGSEVNLSLLYNER